ncbi:MAG: hypothetical protein PHH47_01360 [Gallionella sp.]|nr:hypothetical protein [Gallionella sp.]MDD4946115.1 hypothetical protein [Gallionella sp.]
MGWVAWTLIILFVLAVIGNSAEKKKQQEIQQEALRRRQEAEDYIMNSGDTEAIKTLMLARANPANYSQVMAGGMNRGNDTLKTALGVMTGVVAGNLIADAITASAISSALEDMQKEVAAFEHGSSGSDASSVDSFWGGGDDSSTEL